MKKLITICLLLAIAFSVNAQSNEETIKFIEANLKKIVGQKDKRGNLFTNVSFDGEKLITTQNIGSSEEPILYTRNHSNLNWENVEFRIYNSESLKSKIPGFERLWVSFQKPIRYKVNDYEVEETKTANFYVPIDKVEDLKKAFLSVLPPQEMAKEPTSGKKPTEEETVGFIKRTLESIKGNEFVGAVITKYDFEEKSIFFETERIFYGTKIIASYKYDLPTWDKLLKIDYSKAQGCLEIILIFNNTSVKLTYKSSTNTRDPEIKYESYLLFPIPADKKESLEKAFLRLQEIAKEENKDPFKD